MRRNRRGQAAVESTLVALVLFIVVIGIFDFGQVFFIHQTLAERVRRAVRYSIVNPYNETEFKNIVLYNQPAAPEGATSGFFGITAEMVTVSRSGAGTNDDRIVVTVSNFPYRFFSPLIARVCEGRPITVAMSNEAP